MPDIFVAKEHKKERESKRIKEQEKPMVAKEGTVADRLKSQRTTNPLAALMIRPRKVSFDTQEREEKIILLTRRHLITNARWFLITIGMFLLPGIILGIFSPELTAFRYRSLVILTWYLLTFSYAFQNFLMWFFNVNIVTDERIVDVDFPTMLYRDVSTTKIDKIQDVSAKTGGYIRSLFNYADVHIQTAGAEKEIIFEAVPRPEEVVKILNELMLEEEQEKLEGRVR